MTDSPQPLLDVNARWFTTEGRPVPEFYQYMRALDRVMRSVITIVDTPDAPLPDEVWSEYFEAAASDEATAITTGTGKVTFRLPWAGTGLAVSASLSTAQTSGSIFTVDINKNGSTILSTKITIDNTEKTSLSAATVAVISDTAWAADDEFSVDVDQIGDGTAKGLKVTLFGRRPVP